MWPRVARCLSTGRGLLGGGETGIPGVKYVVAVSSGKGGVGKSTTAVNLAVALAQATGIKVGLLDADVYGPSIPRMMKLTGQPRLTQDKMLIPLENYGIKCMSMGFLMEDNAAAIWRGPMVMSAIRTFTKQVAWAPLDVLVVDMPPGTGDAQISIGQQLAVSGAIIVTTPQDIALIDARRGAVMWRKVAVPILGLIENMSYFQCPKCHHQEYIFGQDGAVRTAEDMDMELLGQIPLQTAVRVTCDEGAPVVASKPHDEVSRLYIEIAHKLMAKLEGSFTDKRQAPNITVTP